MKKVLLVSSIIAASFIASPTAQAADSIALRICEYISVDDKTRLRSFLKQNKLKIRNIFKSIQCNGDNLLVFAAKSKALNTGEFIIGKVSKKVVSANLEEITKHSAHLAEDARDRVE